MPVRIRYVVPLVLVAVLLLSVASCTDEDKLSSDDVLMSFYDAVKEHTLPDSERQDFLKWWSPQLILGNARLVEEGYYELSFPDMSLESTEVWGFDAASSEFQPLNGGALLSAIGFFCEDRDDTRMDCQLWLTVLDALVEE